MLLGLPFLMFSNVFQLITAQDGTDCLNVHRCYQIAKDSAKCVRNNPHLSRVYFSAAGIKFTCI